jgi:hypothetical protein
MAPSKHLPFTCCLLQPQRPLSRVGCVPFEAVVVNVRAAHGPAAPCGGALDAWPRLVGGGTRGLWRARVRGPRAFASLTVGGGNAPLPLAAL